MMVEAHLMVQDCRDCCLPAQLAAALSGGHSVELWPLLPFPFPRRL